MSLHPAPPPAVVFNLSPRRVVVELSNPDVELAVSVLADGRLVAAWYDDQGRLLRAVEPVQA